MSPKITRDTNIAFMAIGYSIGHSFGNQILGIRVESIRFSKHTLAGPSASMAAQRIISFGGRKAKKDHER